jgi:hypothetical protein
LLLSMVMTWKGTSAQPENSVKPDSKRSTAPAVTQTAVDFNHPPRDYVSHRSHGWEVLVEKELAEESPERAKAVLARLDSKLGEIAKVLPTKTLPDLQKVKIFLMHGPHAKSGGRSSGLEYFRSDAPKHYEWLDPRMASSIVIFNAENYQELTDLWALKSLMHEMGHAHHLEHWPEDHAEIFETWKTALAAGRYKSVRPEDKDAHYPNYAAQNISPNSPQSTSQAATITPATAPH